MEINSAQFVKGLTRNQPLPREKFPQYAVVGRSNVGKSSFINTLTKQKNLARTSSTPGRTQQINIFLLNKHFFLADLPGYGFAKMSKEQRIQMENLIFWYLGETGIQFKRVFQIIDASIGPTPLDLEMSDYLLQQDFQTVIIANKIDKVKSSQVFMALKNIKISYPEQLIIPYSNVTGEGRKEVLKELA